MVDPVTTNLGLAQPLHGSNTDQWDQPLNNNAGILDAVAGSITTKSLSVSNVILTDTESRVNILRFTGSLGTSVQVNLGAVIKSWICDNQTQGVTSNYIRIAGAPGTGNTVALPPGTSQIFWDGTNVGFVNLPILVGGYWDFAGPAVPPWVTACTVPPFLLCDGSGYNSLTYPQLFDILGTVTLPDARARVRIPLDGGTNRVTSAASGINGVSRFSAGGQQTVTLDATQIPAHDHTGNTGLNSVGHTHLVNDATSKTGLFSGPGSTGWAGNASVPSGGESAPHTHSISSVGGGLAHTNMPPTYVGGITMIRAG